MAVSWAKRVLGVTASEIPKIMGLDAFEGPEACWEKKLHARLGELQHFDLSEDIERGNALEGAIREWVSKRIGLEIKTSTTYDRVVDGLHCIASPDGEIEDDRLLEIKCPRFGNYAREGYIAQIQWQLFVCQRSSALLAVFADGVLELYPIFADREMQDALLKAASDWWLCVLTGQRPPPRGSQSTNWLKANLEQSEDQFAESESVADAARRYHEASALFKEAEDRKATAAAELQSVIAEHKGVTGSWGKATWSTVKTSKTDWEAVARKLGATDEDVAPFVKQASHRRLTVKLKGEK